MDNPESLERPVYLTSAFFVGIGMCLIIVLLLGFATSKLIVEALTDGKWARLGFIAVTPLLLLVGPLLHHRYHHGFVPAFGPIGASSATQRFFSAIRPSLARAYSEGFTPPPITIQCQSTKKV